MASSCTYDCFNQPDVLKPYGDISGPGVLAGFVVTAYFVVIVIPTLPSSTLDASDPEQRSRRPNPIDVIFLSIIRKGFHVVLSWIGGKLPDGFTKLARRILRKLKSVSNEAFTKSVLCMCDVQIVTGHAILISGYASLPCGLSAYHWQIIIYLAWFSNMTHLSALTFLRKYFDSHYWERAWRVFFMTTLVLMLVVGAVPTAFFNWLSTNEPTVATASSYAICFFNMGRAGLYNVSLGADKTCMPSANKQNQSLTDVNCQPREFPLQSTTSLQSMTVSLVLLVFNFLSRVFKLFQRLSDALTKQVRERCSRIFKTTMRRLSVEIKSQTAKAAGHLSGHLFIYILSSVLQFLLALFLLGRLYLDLYSSMLSEVYWLLVSITWGSFHLVNTKWSTSVGDNAWTFGQILPVILLVAPFITMVEFFIPDTKQEENYGGELIANHSQGQSSTPLICRVSIIDSTL
ncbi:hypothetical protein DM02DRAFT_85068 [Periconia macrospinosa]|uniref:Uncharacterized protein n=1 Tax=Periconia macrospinosa TaxID=97972 RepID=A0A2V1E5K2_9PLEO|nr:hypothetical protein DM02DRAFT_85068 [Periconia macrospinosa]